MQSAGSGARRWIMRQASTRFIGFSAGLWPIARRYQSGSDTQRARPSGVNHALDSFAIRCTTVVPTFRFRPIFSIPTPWASWSRTACSVAASVRGRPVGLPCVSALRNDNR